MGTSSSPRVRPTPVLSSPLLYLTFCQDASCIIAADSSVVQWICCKSWKLRGLYQDASAAIVAAAGNMLDEKCSTCAVVTRTAAAEGRPSSKTTFVVRRWRPGYINYHWRYDELVMEIKADAEVRAVHVHGGKTVLVHDGRVDVYGPNKDGGVLHRVETCGGKPICAVSHDAPFAFAFPGAEDGEACVERWAGEFALSSFTAHSSRLECMAMSCDGRLVATASVKGTIVRVFRTASGALLRELRRGADRADTYSMAFSPDSKWLAVSSDKGTIHVFNVYVDVSTSVFKDTDALHAGHEANANQDVKQGSYWSFLSGFVPGYFKQDYSLAKFRLPEDKKYLVAFSHEPNTILIIGVDGSFYRCEFDPVNGGDMKQLEYKNFMNIQ